VIESLSKKCTGCGEILEANETNFYKRKTGKYGFEAKCKTCRNKQIKAWQKTNEDTERIRSKEWRRNHPEYVKEYQQYYLSSGGVKRANDKRRDNPVQHAKDLGAHRRWVKENPDKNKQSMENYLANNPEKRAQTYKNQRLKSKYGLTLEQYESACQNQNNRCFICKAPTAVLNVDHCHRTTVVRGLLCSNCNHMLGNATDDPEILRKGIEYLLNPPGLFTEPRAEYFENSIDGCLKPVVQSETKEETCKKVNGGT
jgi:hypothetical protein